MMLCMHRSPATVTLAASVVLTSCAGLVGCSETVATTDDSVESLRVEVVETHPHDPAAFTQGLEVDGDRLLEGTGRAGLSWISARPLDVAGGGGTELGGTEYRVSLPGDLFGEGITVAGDAVWQLTWTDEVAVVRDRLGLEEIRRVGYSGEGWGLCAQPDRFVMSDGSADLVFRDLDTFVESSRVTVRLDGRPVERLNELECTDDGFVYANVWQTDDLVRIDPDSGEVTALIDASTLRDLLPTEAAESVDVLNGIAHVPGTDRFLLTGKYWPSLFEVRFVR